MARYGTDYDRSFRGEDYGRDYRADWDRDDPSRMPRRAATRYDEWNAGRGLGSTDRGFARGYRPGFGYGVQGGGSFGYDAGRFGEAGWSGWGEGGPRDEYGARRGRGDYGASRREFGGAGNRAYDEEDYTGFDTLRRWEASHRAGMGGFEADRYDAGGYDVGGGSAGWNHPSTGRPMDRDRFGASGGGRDYGRDFDRHDRDLGDRVREGWDHLRDRARHFFHR